MNGIALIMCFSFSLVALGLSIYACSSQYYADIPTSVLSLMGICATLIVGISIVDVFSIHQVLEKNEEKMDEFDKKIVELSKLEDDVRKLRKQSNILFHHTWGLCFSQKQPYAALAEFWKAFQLAANDNDIKRAKSCLENANESVEDIIRRKEKRGELDTPESDNLPISIPVEMTDSSVFIAFKADVNNLIKKTRKTLEQ